MRGRRELVLSIAALLMGVIATRAAWGKPQVIPKGRFEIEVAGWVEGKGTCQVTGAGVNIDADVKDDDGGSGKLSATNLKLDDVGRFTGDGTYNGKPVKFSGRVDAPDSRRVKNARVSSTFTIGTDKYGRLAGKQ